MNTMFPSKKQILTFFGYAAVTALALGMATASAETTLEKIKRTGLMTSANTFTYPPFGFIDNGKQVGLDVDLGNEIARRMGVKATFQNVDFRGIIAALTSGRVDTLITAMTSTPDREKAMLFSEPYFDGGIGGAYRADKPITNPDEIIGKRVGMELGAAGEFWTREKYGPRVQIKTYDTTFLALKDLENGRLDVVVSTLPPMRYAMRTMPSIRVTKVWDSRIVGVNTRLEDKDLMAVINQHLVAMKKDGTYDKVIAHWFGP
jgi:polar amino acid transport system substrate-binding protein